MTIPKIVFPKSSNAVSAIIINNKNEILLQLRDDKPDIFYPKNWGFFGGAIEKDESDIDALKRELHEELNFQFNVFEFLTRFDFDLTCVNQNKVYRSFYVSYAKLDNLDHFLLNEGKEMKFFTLEEANKISNFVPYDKFALSIFLSSKFINDK